MNQEYTPQPTSKARAASRQKRSLKSIRPCFNLSCRQRSGLT
uniref:Uncharacterized protein n=1 Tax=Arundo donax TaxID=35708 RepID=A0A0A9BYU0_ARUDO